MAASSRKLDQTFLRFLPLVSRILGAGATLNAF